MDRSSYGLQRPAKFDFSSQLFVVTLVNDGGVQGTKTTAATWTYTVKTIGGRQLGTAVQLARPRPKGTAAIQSNAPNYGVAFYDTKKNLKLWDAGENYGTGTC